jgi:hypothetical protein
MKMAEKTRMEKLEAGDIEPGTPLTEKQKNEVELRVKKLELKNKETALEGIPEAIKGNIEGYDLKIKGEEIQRDYIKLQLAEPRILNPYYFVEQNSEWTELRKRDLEYKLDMKEKYLKMLVKEKEKSIKKLNIEETELKEEVKKLKTRIKELQTK